MKKVLILGTNAGQADMINYLKENNFQVHACGHKKEGPGVEIADYFHIANTIDVDAVVNLAKEIKADIIYSVSSDSAIKTVTKASEILNLPHYIDSEIIELFDRKENLRLFLNKSDISTVNYITVKTIDEIGQWQIFPCVVKPSDSQGQRGVRLVDKKSDMLDAVKNAIEKSATHTAIIEEYLQGVEISTNVFVQNGQIIVNEFSERYVHGINFFGLPKGHGIPIRTVDETIVRKASEMVEKMIRTLNLENAILYVQMVATKDGPKIIEVAPRLDGCHIWRLIKFAKGYDLRGYAIKGLLGEKVEHIKADNGMHSLYFYQTNYGKKFYKHDLELIEDNLYNELRYEDDQEILPINGTLEVVGYYIVKD